MQKYNVHFERTSNFSRDKYGHLPSDYIYWIPLMNYFLNYSDAIEIHCWNEDDKVIKEIRKKIGNDTVCKIEGNLTIFSGVQTIQITRYLTHNHLNEHNQLKWFSVFLSKNGFSFFNSEHYGTEFVGFGLDKKQVKSIYKIMPKDTNFSSW